jgi:hypothetical protein
MRLEIKKQIFRKNEDFKMAQTRKSLLESLSGKVNQEYADWRAGLLELYPDEVLDMAYEVVIKSELVCMFGAEGFGESEMQELLSLDNVLDTIYKEWLKCTVSLTNDLKDAVKDAIHKNKERRGIQNGN